MTVVDTDILIDVGRGVREAIDCLNLIAATAICRSSEIVSKNQKHYRFTEDLHLLPYPDPFQ